MGAVTTPTQGPSRWVAETRSFFGAVVSEWHKVTWPSRNELVDATRRIVVLTVVLGLLIGWMDWLLNEILVNGIARLTRRSRQWNTAGTPSRRPLDTRTRSAAFWPSGLRR